MKTNVGSADRLIRIVAGLAVIGAGVFFKSWWGAIGVVPLATAALGFCPLYPSLGLNTCSTKKE
ncbi:MAG: DUF2892 domain-containing protein [Verrucomicrobia bacterium]|nr:DUF2892 domain-containing protein [Verrucomicrobiota bacterium]